MRKIRDVLRLKHEAELSHEQIAVATGLSKGAVTKYLQRAAEAGIGWPLPEGLDDAQLEARLFHCAAVPVGRHAEPDYARMHQELKRRGVTLQLLWDEYQASEGERAYRYSQFCERYRHFAATLRRSMRQIHRAGDKLFIDYSGVKAEVIDPATGEIRRAELNAAIKPLLDELNHRPFKKLDGCRRNAFEMLDLPAMRPLPPTSYEYAEWKPASVNIDYHVEVDRHFYSVSHTLVRQRIEVRLSAAAVECFNKGQRVAAHVRSHQRGGFTTIPAPSKASRPNTACTKTSSRSIPQRRSIGSIASHQLEGRSISAGPTAREPARRDRSPAGA